MAEKLSGSEKPAKEKRPPKTHNMAALTKALDPFLNSVCKMYDEMEKDHGSHVLSINHKFEEIAEKIGFPKGLIRQKVAAIRRAEKAKEALKEMERDEIEQEIELLEAANATTRARDLFTHRLEQLRETLKALPAG